MKLALIVLIGLVLEIFVWIGVGDLVGSMWYVFFWFIAAFFIGLNMIRSHAAALMPQMQQMQQGQMSADPNLTNNLPK
ncbi:MAG: FxsA family protein, partial [Candidatus Acinetobacter avistercoris]|nr:FxsA family protein [Candidatus Acinetobacter avistercoris]